MARNFIAHKKRTWFYYNTSRPEGICACKI